MANKYYPHLFEPLYVGKQQIEFKNRIFMAPMSTEHDPASHVMLDDSIEFYAKRAGAAPDASMWARPVLTGPPALPTRPSWT